jgi:hypothetical protein
MPLYYCCMTPYDAKFTGLHILFDKENVPNTIGEYVSKLGLRQLRIAETEKYAHVTFFLFGGENEGEQIAKHRKHVDDEIASHHKAEPEGEEKAETEEVIEEVEEVEETIFERPAEKEERAEIDRSYYERASQLLDGAASTEGTVAPEPEKKPVPKAKPAAKPAQQTKTASASLEELMKLMEQEQEKLKKQLDKK